jgi:hypothetical protein
VGPCLHRPQPLQARAKMESVHRVAQGRRGHIKRAIGRNKATLRPVKPDAVCAFAMSRDNLHRLLGRVSLVIDLSELAAGRTSPVIDSRLSC